MNDQRSIGRRIDVALRQSDLGPVGHVSNVSVVRIIDEARRPFLGRPVIPGVEKPDGILAGAPAHVVAFLRRQDVEFADELWYRQEPLAIRLWISTVGRTSFTLALTISQEDGAAPAIRAEARMVLVDQRHRGTWAIDDIVGAALARHRGPALLTPVPSRQDRPGGVVPQLPGLPTGHARP
ncbi:acyl-CoA thioesterase [Streptomyces sp. NPDC055078]